MALLPTSRGRSCGGKCARGSTLATKLEFLTEASAEIIEALEFYRLGSPRKAERFDERLNALLALIRDYPRIGQQLPGGLRRVVVPEFPYVIVYRPLAAVVRVVACAHTSRRKGYWRGRSEQPDEAEDPAGGF